MTKLTDAQTLEAHARYYIDGEKMTAVAAAYGMERTALRYRFERLDLPMRPAVYHKAELAPDDLAQAIRRAEGGESLEELAPDYGMSIPTLRRILREAGFQTDARLRRNHETANRNGS
jgi:AraC-like DNA-binding protein